MKYLAVLTILTLFIPVFADVEDDGLIETGEYGYNIRWSSRNPPLIVNGGGADYIKVEELGRIEVYDTSSPINGDWHTGGILDLWITHSAEIVYLDGSVDLFTIRENATAAIKGGNINYIRTLFDFMTTGHVDIYCKPGWTWQRDLQNEIVGITGVWENNNPFSIDFINKEDYDPVWMGVNVIEVPEPVSLLLLSFGGLLIRRKL